MSGFILSLRALGHPASLVAIGLLLLNDHWFKVYYPSYLTGKISDAAGLFFFPFVVTAGLSLIFSSSIHPRRIGGLAFALTLAVFSLLKLSGEFNQWLTSGISVLLGHETTLLQDPEDLTTLIVLWPAWQLWTSLEKTTPIRNPSRSGIIALGLGALASLATSPCLPIPIIDRLVESEGSIFARMYDRWSDEPLAETIAISIDGGRSWDKANLIPQEIVGSLNSDPVSPKTICSVAQPHLCYKIQEEGKVERSEDGGNSWRTAWQIPWGRSYFMDRFIGATFLSCKEEIDLGPYDLTLLDSPGGPTVIVALGNEGVLYGEANGTWRRVSVERAVPTPYSATSMENAADIVLVETVVYFLVGILSLFGFIVIGAHAIPEGDIASSAEGLHVSWALKPLYGMMVYVLIALPIVFLSVSGIILHPVLEIIFRAFTLYISSWSLILIPVLGLFLTLRRLKRIAPGPYGASWIAKTSFLTAAGIFPLAWLPFPTWTLGLLPAYPLAIALSLFLILVTWRWGLLNIRRLHPTAYHAGIEGEINET